MSSINWSDFAIEYFKIISTDLNGLNLTALKSADEILLKQVMDSIVPLEQVPSFKYSLENADFIVDLGTGGGYPLLPMAKIFTGKKLIGIDARKKKLDAVELIAKKLGLNNISTIHATFDQIKFDKPKIVFLVKAVGKISEIMDQLNCDFPTDIYFYKGANFYQLEIEELNNIKNNEQLVNVYDIKLDGLEMRYLIHCKISKNVPRRTINKQNKQQISFSNNL